MNKAWNGTVAVAVVVAALTAAGCRKAPPSPPERPASGSTTQAASGAITPAQPAASAPRTPQVRPRVTDRLLASAGRWLASIADSAFWGEFGRRHMAAAEATVRHIAADPSFHLTVGDRALADGRPEDATLAFRRARKLDPNSADALVGLATALSRLQRWDAAAAAYRKLHALRPEDPRTLYNLGVVLTYGGRFYEAEETYIRLLADKPDMLEAQANLAAVYQVQGKLAQARSAWEQVVSLSPDRTDAWAQLAAVLTDLGEPEKAMEAYAQVAKREPKNVSSWLNLAAAAHAAGSFGRAAACLEHAAELAPQDAAIWRRLHTLYLDLNRATSESQFLQKAVVAARESLRLDETQADLRKWLATFGGKVPTSSPSR